MSAETHLRSVSVRAGGFMPLRGVGAGPHRTDLLLGQTPGLIFTLGNASRTVDPDAVYALLVGPSEDRAISLQVSNEELWSGISLWLALHASGMCHLAAIRATVQQRLVPDLFDGSAQFHATIGLFEGAMLCVLLRSSEPIASQEGILLRKLHQPQSN